MTTDFPPLVSILQQIPDPRRTQGRRYSLPVLLTWMSVATMCGYTSYSSMTEWASHYGSSLLRVIGFTGDRVPCKGWLSRLLRRLDVEALEARLNEWAEAVLAWLPPSDATEEAFSADGKALRGSRKQGAPGAYLLSILGVRLGLVLHQRAVPEDLDVRTNEIPVLEELLRGLLAEGRLRDRVWTMDALHTQQTHAELIVQGGGDYIMIAKGNQKTLREDIRLLFDSPQSVHFPQERAETVERGHGRIERRQIVTSAALNAYLNWPSVGQVFRVRRETETKKSGKTREQVVYGVTSLTPERADAAQLLNRVRCHWHIENRLHWVRDVTYNEDRSTVRCPNTPEIMAAIRNVAIGLIRLAGYTSIASACRAFAAKPERALALIGIKS